tara:strand:+ start:758 stop:1573 length:816 start_codon:yes stop_codon:yes gene_type:complete
MTLQNNNILQNSNKRLSVQLSLSGLSFLVTNIETKEIYFFLEKKYKKPINPEELIVYLKSIFNENKELNDTFNEVAAIYATSLYSLVPSNLFDALKTSEYLKFNSKILATDFIAFDTLENHNITTVYIPFININNYLFDRFGDFSYYHSSSLLIEHLLREEKSDASAKVYINITDHIFDFITVKNGELIICNSYEFTTAEDFIYYILFCLEQLKLNPDTVDLYISGSIEKEEDTYKILYNYIRNITFYGIGDQLILTEKESSHQNLLLKLL